MKNMERREKRHRDSSTTSHGFQRQGSSWWALVSRPPGGRPAVCRVSEVCRVESLLAGLGLAGGMARPVCLESSSLSGDWESLRPWLNR